MSAADAVRIVKIFVSSPADVTPERGRVQAIVAKLNRELDGLIRLETVLWEEHFYKADRSFQPQIPDSVACDILISIFWTRVGTELPDDFPRMPGGRSYPSGTAYELLTALEASKAKGVPDVYVFRKTADAILPLADAERRRQAQTQIEALEAFWSEWFKSEQGHFKAAFQTFGNTDEFERQGEQLLRQWLDSQGLLGPRLLWSRAKGSPFRGLAPFEAEHAAIFFGRDRVVDEACRRLAAAVERATPFLLIVGASGVGKSSLARAGLIPRLTTLGVVTSVDIWRVVSLKPGEGQAGPLSALATAVFAAVPELEQGDFTTAANLTDHLRRGGAPTALPIVRALARIAEAARRERRSEQPLRPALLLLVDQLEELFAQAIGDEERTAFVGCLKELVASRQVWCIATLRADLYELLLRQPVLKTLKESGASLDLGPPGSAELAEIVRAPAVAAGLVFETSSAGIALDERLLEDAKSADSLPLLQFTLRQLYEHRTEEHGRTVLTHAAYDALGGLQGAVAAEAEHAVAGLPTGTLDALPRLLRRLAEPARDGTTLTLREMLRSDIAVGSAETLLVDALLGARILIARQDVVGRPTLRLAHDAVLTSWPKAKIAAQASREFYRVRAEIEDAFRRWREHGQPNDRLIQRGVPLAEAEKLIADFGPELPPEIGAYINASRRRAQVRQRLVGAAAVFFFALAVVATWAGILAYQAKRQAVAAKEQAIESEQMAVAAQQRAVASEQSALAAKKDAEQSRDSERLTRNYIDRVGDTLEALTGFAPEETEAMMRQSIEAIRAGSDLDTDKVTFQQVDALEEMARYFYDCWDGLRANQFLQDSDERLQRVSSGAASSSEFTRLRATRLEIAGDLDMDDDRRYASAASEYDQALGLFENYRKTEGKGGLANARVHRKIALFKVLQHDYAAADSHIAAASQLLDDSDEAKSERAALDDLIAAEAMMRNNSSGGEARLQEAVALDRQVLDKEKQAQGPILRLSASLATHLQHLGDVLRREGNSTARSVYDEAEILASEILETYPNQAGTRFMLDLIRHGRSLLADKGAVRPDSTMQTASAASGIDTSFGGGFPPFKFGMTPAQVNALLDHPFGNVEPTGLPRASEYRTGEVRYFWAPISDLKEFRSFYNPVSSCLDQSLDYVVFMFHENSLMRISFRLYGPPRSGCGNRLALFPDLAGRFHMPLLGTPKQWRLHWETHRVSVIGTTYKEGPMLDIVTR